MHGPLQQALKRLQSNRQQRDTTAGGERAGNWQGYENIWNKRKRKPRKRVSPTRSLELKRAKRSPPAFAQGNKLCHPQPHRENQQRKKKNCSCCNLWQMRVKLESKAGKEQLRRPGFFSPMDQVHPSFHHGPLNSHSAGHLQELWLGESPPRPSTTASRNSPPGRLAS